MKIIKINELNNYDYSIKVINALKQYWKQYNNTFNCINYPKKLNILLYFDGCDANYTLKDGTILKAKSGDVVYAPQNSEYSINVFNHKTSDNGTIGVNFQAFTLCGTPFILSDKIEIFRNAGESCKLLFYKIDTYSERAVPDYARMKAGFYDIIAELAECKNKNRFDKYSTISKGILYMEEDSTQNLSIPEIAAMCNVSESYFRRLFREYSGMSPIEYKLNHKISRAKNYLEHSNMSVSEISYKLAFASTAYFIKTFKEFTSMTPLEYRKSIK